MKSTPRNKILYWIVTAPFVLVMSFSVWSYFQLSPEVVDGMKHAGYPLYFLKILGTAKFLGVLAILVDRFKTLKEWAYAGFVFTMLGAFATHSALHDPIGHRIAPLVFLALLAASYALWKRLSKNIYS
jgi:hypothetical protein